MPIYAGSNLISKIATGISSALAVYAGGSIRFGGGGVNPPPWTPYDLFSPTDEGVWFDLDDDMDTKLAFRRNQLLWSEDLGTAPWTNVQGVSTYVAYKIIPAATTLIHGRRQALDFIAGRSMIVSMLVKQAESGINLEFFNFNSTGVVVNPTTWAVTSALNCTVTLGDFDVDGYRKIFISYNENNTTTNNFDIRLTRSTSRDVAFVGDGVEGLYVKNVQREFGTVATAYQKVTNWNTEFLAQFPNHALFQDSAGVTAVTAVEQPLGLVLDKSKGLVRGVELVDTANTTSAWVTSGTVAVSEDLGGLTFTTVDGTGTATLTMGASGGLNTNLTVGKRYQFQAITKVGVGNSVQIRFLTDTVISSIITTTEFALTNVIFLATATSFSVDLIGLGVGEQLWIGNISVKEIAGNHRTQATAGNRPAWSARKNLLLATATMSTQNITSVATPYTISHTGTGTITLSGTSTAGPLVGAGSLTFTPTAGTLTMTVSGTVSNAQLEYGSTATTYQSVVTDTDYNAIGFSKYCKYDGVDDGMATASIDFTATDTMTVSTGLTKLSDVAQACFLELSATSVTNNAFGLFAPASTGIANYGFRSTGTITSLVSTAGFSAPITNVVTAIGDISADQCSISINGGALATVSTDQGTGNYGNYPLFFGRRGGTSLSFNGQENQSFVINRILTEPELTQLEQYIATKTGVTL